MILKSHIEINDCSPPHGLPTLSDPLYMSQIRDTFVEIRTRIGSDTTRKRVIQVLILSVFYYVD